MYLVEMVEFMQLFTNQVYIYHFVVVICICITCNSLFSFNGSLHSQFLIVCSVTQALCIDDCNFSVVVFTLFHISGTRFCAVRNFKRIISKQHTTQ